MDEVVLHGLDVLQVDQIALVAAGEMVLCQLLFGAGEAGPDRKLPFCSVIPEQPVTGLQIIDVVGGEHLHSAACQLQNDLPAPAALHSLDGPGELGAELVVIHRLEHIVQRIHLIALDGVLRHVGHEHQHGVPVHGPYLFRRAEAVQPRHLHVHKDDVPARLVMGRDDRPVLDGHGLHLQAVFGGVLPDEPAQLVPHLLLVFDNRDLQHPAASFSPF